MSSWPDNSTKSNPKRQNYRVRFRHGVFPDVEEQATRKDIKKYDYFFDTRQTWMTTPRNIDFVHETPQGVEAVESILTPSLKSGKKETRRTDKLMTLSTNKVRRWPSQPGTTRVKRASGTYVTRDLSPSDSEAWQMASQQQLGNSPGPNSESSLDENYSSSWAAMSGSFFDWLDSRRKDFTTWPFQDANEVRLFRFWTEHAAAWFDVLSPHGVFKDVVPALALENPMLLNAVLLITAQHIKSVDPHFPVRPYVYHERLLHSLIPYLSERGRIDDEGTLVAAMLLRSFEEHHAGSALQENLSPIEVFQGTSGRLDINSPVVQACFMMHVHDEICHALLHQSQLRVDYDDRTMPGRSSTTNDTMWRNQIVWRCGQVLQKLQGQRRDGREWQEMTASIDDWEIHRPRTFEPMSLQDESLIAASQTVKASFRERCHADGFQYLQISRMALAWYRHGFDSIQPEHEGAQRQLHDEIVYRLRRMIAVARYNIFAIPSGVTAAHAVHFFGVILRYEADRRMMIEFLEEVEGSGWRTTASIAWLRRCWYREGQI